MEYFAEIVRIANNTITILPAPRRLKLKSVVMRWVGEIWKNKKKKINNLIHCRPVPHDFDLTGEFMPSVIIEWFTPTQSVIIFNNQNTNLKYLSVHLHFSLFTYRCYFHSFFLPFSLSDPAFSIFHFSLSTFLLYQLSHYLILAFLLSHSLFSIF